MGRKKNLSELIDKSNSSRSFFLSLPVDIQMQLHEHGHAIHTAEDLRYSAGLLSRQKEFLQQFPPQDPL